jgi:hypothetical protein
MLTSMSTLARELAFVLSHTIHHQAMIGLMASLRPDLKVRPYVRNSAAGPEGPALRAELRRPDLKGPAARTEFRRP